MVELRPLSLRLKAYGLALFWGLVVAVTTLITLVRKGPKKFFDGKTRNVRPACLDDPTLGVHQYVKLKKIRMHYVESGPKGKPLMLFVHGFPEFWYSWRHQIRAFNANFRCVAIDMRGYGETEKPKGLENYFVLNMMEDLRELIIALGYEKCTLVANDWGGFVAQFFTHHYPSMVQRLILCNIPHPTPFEEYLFGNWKQFMMSWYVFFFQVPLLPEIQIVSFDYGYVEKLYRKTASPEDVEAYKWSLQIKGGVTNPLNYYRAMIRYTAGRLPNTPIPCPTLMVWGVKDEALSKETASASAGYFSDFTLRFVEGVGHWIQMEAPEETNKHIKEFLSRKKIQ